MRDRRATAVAAAITLLFALLATGCDDLFEMSCETDQDCTADGEICVDQVCTAICQDDADCSGDEACVERPGQGSETVCRAVYDTSECTVDADCGQHLFCDDGSCAHDGTCTGDFDCPGGEVCEAGFCVSDGAECFDDFDCPVGFVCDAGSCVDDGAECFDDLDCPSDQICDAGFCVDDGAECAATDDCPPGFVCDGGICHDQVGYNTILIEDRTDTVGRCDDTTMGYDTAGAKLMYAELWASDGSFLADGTAVDYHYGANTNFGDIGDVLDGSAPDFDGECPTDDGSPTGSNFRDDQVVAIGCGGWVALQFFDDDGYPMHLIDGDYVAIGEFGPACNDTLQTADDAYDVSICNTYALSSSGFDPTWCLTPSNAQPIGGSDTITIHL